MPKGPCNIGSNQINQQALNTLYERDIESLVRLQRLENTLLEVRFRAAGVLLDQLPIPGSLNHLRESRTRVATLWDELRLHLDARALSGEALEAAQQLEQGFAMVDATLAKLEQGYAAKDRKALTAVLEDDWALMHKAAVKPMQALIPVTQQRAAEGYAAAREASRPKPGS